MTHVTCRLTAKNRDQLRNHTHSNAIAACKKFTAHDSDQRLQTFAMAEYIHRVSKKFTFSVTFLPK